MELDNDIDELLEKYWNIMNEANKVSLLVKFIDVKTEKEQFRIKNKLICINSCVLLKYSKKIIRSMSGLFTFILN